MEQSSSKSPTCAQALTHTQPQNSASRGHLSYCASLQEHQSQTSREAAASSRGFPSPASLPAAPRDRRRHNSMLTQSRYRVTMPHFCPRALIPQQPAHLETRNSFPEIRHWGCGGEGIIHSCPYPTPDCGREQPSLSHSVTSAQHSLALCPTTSSAGMSAPRGASRPPKGGFDAQREHPFPCPEGAF